MMKANDYSSEVARRLDDFLTHPSKRVLLFKGKWGVGKTHYWTKTFLPERLERKSGIKERLYAYVSLFGVENVGDLEHLILGNSTKTGEKNSIHFIETGLRKAASFAELIPAIKDYQGLINRIGHIAIRNTLICLDEIERKASGLSIEAVMGLISILREHNGCRFILIMNDEHIEGSDAEVFKKYREKIIDETISFTPSIEDNARLIFGSSQSSRCVVDVFKRLGISNLRVIQQAAWAVDHFTPLLGSLEPSIQQQFQEQIVLLTAFFHIPMLGIDVNSLPRNTLMEHLFNRLDDKSPEHKQEMEMARRYKYAIQEYDCLIVDYLKDGRCDQDRLETLLDEANVNERQGQIQAKFQAMWLPYNRSFKANTREVLNAFSTFLDQHASQLGFSQLLALFPLIDDMGGRSKRRKWLDAWITPQIGRSSLKGLRTLEKHCHSARLKREIKKREKEIKQSISIHVIMSGVVAQSGWGPEQVKKLGSCDVNDFKKEFLVYDGDNFLALIHEFCNMWRNSHQEEQAVVQRIEKALLSIAKRSKLDMRRVRMVIPWAFPDSAATTANIPFDPDLTE